MAEAAFGLLARFDDAAGLLAAVRALQDAGCKDFDAYAPYPVPGLAAALAKSVWRLPVIVLASAVAAGVGGFVLQWWSAVFSYPFVVGGKPLHDWAPFMPVTIALALLAPAVTSLVAMLALNGLPRPYHPAFNVAAFARATDDGFFLLAAATDRCFDPVATGERLRELAAVEIWEVPA